MESASQTPHPESSGRQVGLPVRLFYVLNWGQSPQICIELFSSLSLQTLTAQSQGSLSLASLLQPCSWDQVVLFLGELPPCQPAMLQI